jgi:hypothetical protein
MPFELASVNELIDSIQVKNQVWNMGEEDMTFETHAGIFHNRIPWLTKQSRECAK